MRISEHIGYSEAVTSQTATRLKIDNTPNEVQLNAMKLVAETCFEPIRRHFNVPLRISSFFRSEALNKAIGGSKTSQHCKGEAIDIQSGHESVTNRQIHDWIKANLIFDQCIDEYSDKNNEPSWVHVSFSKAGNRNQCLIVK